MYEIFLCERMHHSLSVVSFDGVCCVGKDEVDFLKHWFPCLHRVCVCVHACMCVCVCVCVHTPVLYKV